MNVVVGFCRGFRSVEVGVTGVLMLAVRCVHEDFDLR